MKSQVAANAVAIATLAREGFSPSGDLIFAATADEEVGSSDFGLSWLCEEHPDAVRAEFCVNEGGGDRMLVDGRPVYLCAVAEKMSSPFLLRVRGRSGHASMPGIADNALVKAAAPARAARRAPARAAPPARDGGVLLRRLRPRAGAGGARGRARRRSTRPWPRWSSRCSRSRSRPTMIEASRKRNVIPALCDVTCDCRLLPGQSPGGGRGGRPRLARRRRLRADTGSRASAARARPPHTPLWEALERLDRARRSRARRSSRSSSRASPTATTCARPSARSRTASSPCGR